MEVGQAIGAWNHVWSISPVEARFNKQRLASIRNGARMLIMSCILRFPPITTLTGLTRLLLAISEKSPPLSSKTPRQ
jgi:hypothetical protein